MFDFDCGILPNTLSLFQSSKRRSLRSSRMKEIKNPTKNLFFGAQLSTVAASLVSEQSKVRSGTKEETSLKVSFFVMPKRKNQSKYCSLIT